MDHRSIQQEMKLDFLNTYWMIFSRSTRHHLVYSKTLEETTVQEVEREYEAQKEVAGKEKNEGTSNSSREGKGKRVILLFCLY